MYLKEAYKNFLASCDKEDEKCSFSTFCNCLIMCFSLAILQRNGVNVGYMKNYSINWKLWVVITKVYGGKLFYLIYNSPNSSCWSYTSDERSDGKKLYREKRWVHSNHTSWIPMKYPICQEKDPITTPKMKLTRKLQQ